MVEILFSDSAAGSLKEAKTAGQYAQSPVLEEPAAFHLALSVGDISGEGVDDKRLAALERLFSVYPENVGGAAARSLFDGAADNLYRLRRRLYAGGQARLWYSGHPDEWCGFYWLMAQLKNWGVVSGVFAVRRTEGWSGAPAGAWQKAEGQVELTPARISAGADKWRTLQRENAPLRAIVRGRLQSVPENFYDGWLEREIEAQTETFQEAQLIGAILGRRQTGTSDAWLALRLEQWIRQGRLQVVTAAPEGSPKYHRILKRIK